MDVIGSVKRHPYLFGGVLVGGLLLFMVVKGARNSNAGAVEGAAVPQGAVEQGTALQVASMQASAQAQAAQYSLQETQAKIAGTIALADLQGKYAGNIAEINAGVENNRISATADVSKAQSTLAASVKSKELETAKEIQLGSFANVENMARISADLQKSISGQLASVQINNQNNAAELARVHEGNSYYLQLVDRQLDYAQGR